MAKRSLGGKITILLFFGTFLGLGLVALGTAASGAYYGAQSELWPSTEGHIEQSSAQTRRRRKGRRSTRLRLSYSYAVDGISYVNDQARFLDNMFFSKTDKQAIVGRFPAGSTAPVIYDPENPQRSVLVRGYSKVSLAGGCLLGSLFVSLGGWGVARSYR